MVTRSKLIDQIYGKPGFLTTISAASTAQETGQGVDRLGANSCQLVLMGVGTAEETTPLNIYLYDCNTVSGSYTIYESATVTTTLNCTAVLTSAVVDVDLSGAKRWIKPYIYVSAAMTLTATVSVAVVLGDYDKEPAS